MPDIREGILRLTGDQEEMLRAVIDAARHGMFTVMPVQVIEDSAGSSVKIKMSVKGLQKTPDGKVKEIDYPHMEDVPIHFISGGGDDKDGKRGNKSVVLTHPIAKGDEGVALFASGLIDNWFEKGDVQTTKSDMRRHSLSDPIYIPGVRSKPRAVKNVSKDAAQLRSVDGKQTLETHPDKGFTLKSVDKEDKSKDPFKESKKYFESKILAGEGIKNSAVKDNTKHEQTLTHDGGHALEADNAKHKVAVHPSEGVKAESSKKVHVKAPIHQIDAATNISENTNISKNLNVGQLLTAATGSFGGFGFGGGGGGGGGGNLSMGGSVSAGTTVKAAPRTVAQLASLTPADGDTSFVTDSSVVTFRSVVADGGTSHVPVFYDGGTSNWRVG